jgi:hypothetical protein
MDKKAIGKSQNGNPKEKILDYLIVFILCAHLSLAIPYAPLFS